MSFSLDRRSFLKTSAAASLGYIMAPRLCAEPKSRTVRLGMIGVGRRGEGLLTTLLMFPQVEIPAICDLDPERAQLGARRVDHSQGGHAEIYAGTETAWEKLMAREDLDGVIIATPWEWHTPMAVAAMKSGKHPGVEVPAAITVDQCWELVRTSEKTGIPCTMLENVCYFRKVLALLRMVREGAFGDLLHAEAGYQHDCRFLCFDDKGGLTWRGKHFAEMDGNLYPTHAVGPIAQWMNINRGDRFLSLTSVSTPGKGLKEYAAKKFGAAHESARRNYVQGDINTTLLKTANGLTVTLYYNTTSHRPYDLILRLQGVKGIYQGLNNSVCLEDSGTEDWKPFDSYEQKYDHPLWKAFADAASKAGGHEGAEYLMFYDYLKAVRSKVPAPQDVYDAAAWSAIFPLSMKSVAKNGALVDFPDFTRGKWKTAPPLAVYGA